jgi:hypothetical protein
MANSTIRIDNSTRQKLARLKLNPRETYDDVLNRLMALVPSGDDEGPYFDAFRLGLLMARLDVNDGRLVDHDEVKKRLAL